MGAEEGRPPEMRPEAMRAVAVSELRDRIHAERTAAGRRFWRQFFPSAGATILATLFALIDDSVPAWVLAAGFLVMSSTLLRWHLASLKRLAGLRRDLAGLLAAPHQREVAAGGAGESDGTKASTVDSAEGEEGPG